MATPLQADILAPLEMNGIIEFVDGNMVVRARIKTLPGKQWGVGRAYNEIVKSVFNQSDIQFPAGPAPISVQTVPADRPPGDHQAEQDRDDEPQDPPMPAAPDTGHGSGRVRKDRSTEPAA
jgi:small conductance mechanosensitive channel